MTFVKGITKIYNTPFENILRIDKVMSVPKIQPCGYNRSTTVYNCLGGLCRLAAIVAGSRGTCVAVPFGEMGC